MKEARWQDWSIVLLGVWLVLSPFIGIGVTGDIAAVNSYVVGTAVAFFAFAAISRPRMWKEFTNLVLGFWLIVAPFTLGFANLLGPTVNQIIVGLLVGGIALMVTLGKTTPTVGHGGHGHGHA